MYFPQVDSVFRSIATSLKSSAHAIAPVSSVGFDVIAWMSLACYLLFAVVAINYALKPWAEKLMLACIVGGTAASLTLHLSMLSTPSYVGEGPLWKFVSLSQYLPWAVFSLSCLYLLYRIGARLLKSRS
ncbi:hypothetical protein KUF54_07405 [Comamonas sp. Y33R10-2]|uniref:hypothetical protein n=1 Tax=Comamonas sp. Y33R10-2 TaxID=2853257 RepID=UPI001C5CB7B4|nr:hypothetical protein [Comamonas sp. Y33R10-2]QXZ11007.1 hypothetical protein KUF54_07405 [Comamonas sp. Y33R10-2]